MVLDVACRCYKRNCNYRRTFDDAQLQQFINSKTNRPIEMAYEVHRYEGNAIGVIRIAKQERPLYATKN